MMDKHELSQENLEFFTYLYKTYYEEVLKYVSVITKNRLSCEDIVQETFIVALNRLDIVKKHEAPDKWLFVTAKHIVYDILKRKATTFEVPTEMEKLNLTARDSTETELLFFDLEKVLKPEEVSVLKKHLLEGYSIKEISKQLAANPGSTRMKFSRIYKKLRNSKIFLFYVALLVFFSML